jgi:predicted Zn-dependent protease
MINQKSAKLLFLTASVCLAGLSMSNLTIDAREESIEERIFKRLEYAVEQGKLQQSKNDIQRVLRLNPRHAGATFYAGLYSYENKRFKTAEKFLRRVDNHAIYGAKARTLLAEMRMNEHRKRFLDNLEIALKGEAYGKALEICQNVLAEMPDNKDILFLATYAAAMNGYREQAEQFLSRYNRLDSSIESKAELKAFVDAIFSVGYEPEVALEKLMSLSDPRLLTSSVRKKIKDLIVEQRQLDKFEKFINQEKKRAGADINSLERELIEFLIEQNQYERALELINQRPTNQIEDNLLYVKLLILTKQEEKAMLTSRLLLSSNPQDLRLYEAWTDAWLGYADRNMKSPDGQDETGKSFAEMAEETLDRLKMDKLVTMRPSLLLKLLRLAILTENEAKAKEIRANAVKIAFTDELAIELLSTADNLIAIDRSSIAADLLESARNQLHDNHELSMKLGEIYFINNNPEAGAKILEDVLKERPEMIRAFLLWTDCMTLMGKNQEAEKAVLLRLAEPEINELVKRQLENKLEVIRMQTMVQDTSEENNYQSQTGDSSELQQEEADAEEEAEPEQSEPTQRPVPVDEESVEEESYEEEAYEEESAGAETFEIEETIESGEETEQP